MSEMKRIKGMRNDRQIKAGKSTFLFGFSLSSIEDEGGKAPDRISYLPDEILGMILYPLSLQEVIRTSVLSKRWRHVWKSTLKFDLKLRTGS